MIKDRFGKELKKPEHRPTIQQSVDSWALVNELIELGYFHNFQNGISDIADYIYKVSALLDKALLIKAKHKTWKKIL